MRTARVLLLVAVLSTTWSVQGARAGGVSYWEWGAAYAPGETVDERVELWLRGETDRSVRRGRSFNAYVVPKAGYNLQPPHLPRSAVLLDELDVKRLKNTAVYAFRLRFEVPRLEPGDYTVVACDDPCREEPFGLVETALTIVRSPAEARAIRYAADRDARLQRQIWTLDGTLRREARRALAPAIQTLEDRLSAQQERIDELIATRRASTSRETLVEAVLAVVAIAGVLSAVMIMLVRRRAGVPRANVQG